jgi:hypothetical protein
VNAINRFSLMSKDQKGRIHAEILASCDLIADCWVYRGTKNPKLCYGMKYIQGKMRTVSRFMLAYATRESLDLKDYDACHVRDCPYRACCNPNHLFWGSYNENCKQREEYDRETRQSRLLELPHLYPQPVLGHQAHAEWIQVEIGQ